jgi:hypothetical protein
MGRWGVNFQDSVGLSAKVRPMLSAPSAFEVVVEDLGRGSMRVRIHPRTVAGVADVLPRSEARIEITGAGWFRLLLDGVLTLDEIYDHDDEIVLELLSDFCAIAESYLRGAGTITSRVTRRGVTHVSVILAAGDDQYLLEGRMPGPKKSPFRRR